MIDERAVAAAREWFAEAMAYAEADADQYFRAALIRDYEVAMAKLAAIIARHYAWHPIETAPKDGTHVLLLCRSPKLRAFSDARVMQGQWGGNTGYEKWYTLSHYAVEPTHWMPLPPPPEKP